MHRLFLAVALIGCSEGAVEEQPRDATTDASVDETSIDAAVDTSSAMESAIDAGCMPPDDSLLDLDGDGKPETKIAVAVCGAGVCLTTATTSVKLSEGSDACTGQVVGARIRDIGDHVGTSKHEVAVWHCTSGVPSLSIVDVAASAVVGHAVAPGAQKNAWVLALADPSGKLHPFLAPSYGDAIPVDPTYGAGTTWGYGCVFDLARASDPRCGVGFGSFTATPSDTWFREVGGYAIDLDDDGWEDPTLIFHQRAFAVSGKTGALLSQLEYDVAAATEPSSPKWFHSGRNYGTHSAFVRGAEVRTVEVGGAPIGTFEDYNCNVSRFLAVLSSQKGVPSSRKLLWSRYVGFASSIFSVYDEAHASDPASIVTRMGNFVDRCVHRFDDSRVDIDGKPAVLYDIFHGSTVDTCIDEQYALYLGSPSDPDPEKRPFGPMKSKVWADCQQANLKAKGSWAMEALSEADGSSITGGTGNYVWGWSKAIAPGGETLYLVETLPPEHRFDLSDVPAGTMNVYALIKGLWTSRGAFPKAGRPKIVMKDGDGARGVGAYSGFAELSLKDIDCDGYPDIELTDGTFVGYRGGAFVAK